MTQEQQTAKRIVQNIRIAFDDRYSTQEIITFVKGYLMAIDDFGIWKNGSQYIGCMENNVKDLKNAILKEIQK